MIDEKKGKMNVIIAEDVIKQMIEGKDETAQKLLKKIKQMSNNNVKELNPLTTSSHLLRGILTAKPKSNINNLQKLLSFTKILPSFADPMNEKECRDELISIVKMMGGKK